MRSITYDGVDLESYGVLLDHVSQAPRANYTLRKTEIFDGGAVLGEGRREALTVRVRCVVLGASASDLQSKLDAVLAVLGRGRSGVKVLTVDDARFSGRCWYASITGDLIPEDLGPRAAGLTLSFYVPRGCQLATADTVQTVNVLSDEHSFYAPASAELVVAGRLDPAPVFTLTHSGGDSWTSVEIENLTTEEVLLWNYNDVSASLVAGDVLEIDCELMTVKSTRSGVEASELGAIYPGAQFPVLRAGVRNALQVSGADGATLAVSYRARY